MTWRRRRDEFGEDSKSATISHPYIKDARDQQEEDV
jgi:hypothetical protein